MISKIPDQNENHYPVVANYHNINPNISNDQIVVHATNQSSSIINPPFQSNYLVQTEQSLGSGSGNEILIPSRKEVTYAKFLKFAKMVSTGLKIMGVNLCYVSYELILLYLDIWYHKPYRCNHD